MRAAYECDKLMEHKERNRSSKLFKDYACSCIDTKLSVNLKLKDTKGLKQTINR
jgi:hypothetical protein